MLFLTEVAISSRQGKVLLKEIRDKDKNLGIN